ncbi:hypothetical protein [Candidatus Epulonipiscium viviparus]|uniref:hypothetical protein n=1 Tax=Candidatus Epulonipiscium viviparus TaxID=420336 RepID=UPI0012EAC0C7|nr:hypothetical protein [Candidatus Epulopiscium viviparus]
MSLIYTVIKKAGGTITTVDTDRNSDNITKLGGRYLIILKIHTEIPFTTTLR